jgi:hypothetical protein
MSNKRPKGSTVPMWWGIFVIVAFTVAATIRFHTVDGPLQAATAQEFQQSAAFAAPQD